MKETLSEIALFSEKIITLGSPTSLGEIDSFEKRTKLRLPEDYKTFLQRFNGISLLGTIVYGIVKNEISMSIEEAYKFEHDDVDNPMFDYLIPFSPDGGGNHYCFDTTTFKDESCSIVFWQHDYPYSDSDKPEVTNESFASWLKEVVIDWTLEDYDYEGNSKQK